MALLTNHLRRWRYAKVLPYLLPGQKILDLGCGDGRIIKLLPPNVVYVGVDTTPYHDQITQALKEAGLQGKFHRALIEDALEELDRHRSGFDRILLLAVLEHLRNPNQVLNQLHVLLKKPDGLILATTPSKIGGFGHQCLAHLKLVSKDAVKDHDHFLSGQEFSRLANLELRKFSTFEAGLNQLVVLGHKKPILAFP